MRRPLHLPRRAKRAWRALPLLAIGLTLGVAAACGGGDEAHPSGASSSDAGTTPETGSPVDVDAGADAGGDASTDSGPVPSMYGFDSRVSNTTCVAPLKPASGASVSFTQVYAAISPFETPMMMVTPPGDPDHWLLATRSGKVLRFPVVGPTSTTVVANISDLSGLLLGFGGEGGFLGIAPHPKFAQNGRLYVTWNSGDASPGAYLRSRIGYITTPSPATGAAFTTYNNILWFDQLYATHYGGGIAFGRDGYLYASFGDGSDPIHGQSTSSFYAKILRLDVDNVPVGSTYGIPADNPFRLGGGEPATFAFGFRNPFRFSFDRETGDLWVGDVGEANYEEVDRVLRGGNYGWPCREGFHDYFANNPTYCPAGAKASSIDPIVENEHVNGVSTSRSVTGGVVYRGKAIPSFVGTYVYGDYVTGELFAVTSSPSTGATETTAIAGAPLGHWVSFSEDADGEVYAVDLYGSIWKMVPPATPPPASTFPAKLSQTGCVLSTDPTKPAAGVVPYDVNAPLWSDGADKQRFFAIPDGKTITASSDGDLDLPIGSVAMKTFSIGAKRVETRLFVRHQDGTWGGYSYQWLDDGTDAVLLPASSRKVVGGQDWYFPSRAECMRCHTERAGFTLGLELGQLNRDFVYESTHRIANQLATFEHVGLFAAALPGAPSALPRLPSIDGPEPLADRARAYVHSNCSMCHRPPGEGRATMDLRFTTAFADTKTCGVAPQAGALGIANPALIRPPSPASSIVSIRTHTLEASRMPPLGSSVVDTKGTALLDAWITSLTACP